MKATQELEELGFDHEEHMLNPVPKADRRPTFGIAVIWVGFGFVVTGLVVGGQLAGQGGAPGMSFWPAMGTIASGEAFLFILTILLGIPAMRYGFNLALLSRFSFGRVGIVLPMAVMAMLTLGWFASILGMIGDIWGALFKNATGITVFDPAWIGRAGIAPLTLEVVASCVIFGALFTWTAYRGIVAIEKVAIPIAPFVLITAATVGVAILMEGGGWGAMLQEASTRGGMGYGHGLTIVIGAWIAGAIMGVDVMRFAKNVKTVIVGAAACFILTNPLLNVVGYVGSIVTGDSNFVNWMYSKGLLLALLGALVWTTSLWTTNNSELYSNSLYTGPALDAVGVRVRRTTIVLVVGVVGTVLGSIGFYQMFFADFITVLGAAFVPLAGPILADYYLLRRSEYSQENVERQPRFRPAGIISFLVGAVCGLLFQYAFTLPFGFSSGVAALIVTLVVHVALHYLLPAGQLRASPVAPGSAGSELDAPGSASSGSASSS